MTSRRQQRARQAKRPASGSSRPAEVAFFKVKVFLLIIVRKKVAGGAEHGQPGTAERALLEEERMRVGAENVSKNQGLPSALSI